MIDVLKVVPIASADIERMFMDARLELISKAIAAGYEKAKEARVEPLELEDLALEPSVGIQND